jgi:hypothetical protein
MSKPTRSVFLGIIEATADGKADGPRRMMLRYQGQTIVSDTTTGLYEVRIGKYPIRTRKIYTFTDFNEAFAWLN